MEGKDISHSYTEDKIYGRVDLLEKTIMYTHRREDDKNIAFETINTFRDAYAAASRFYINLADSFIDASLIPLRNLCRIKPVQKPEDIEKVIASKVRDSFDRSFKEEIFVKSLAELLDSHSRLAKLMGLGKTYQGVSNLNSLWNTVFLESLRDTTLLVTYQVYC